MTVTLLYEVAVEPVVMAVPSGVAVLLLFSTIFDSLVVRAYMMRVPVALPDMNSSLNTSLPAASNPRTNWPFAWAGLAVPNVPHLKETKVWAEPVNEPGDDVKSAMTRVPEPASYG